ncbi:MAG: SDR family NAD(P)-dependent oxidoreductase [Gammaproteobacteria bacterium]
MYALKAKVAVVTGAGSGIGRALAQLLAKKGCELALADINEAALKETASTLSGDVLLHRLDVADRAAVYAFAGAVQQRFGTAHVVINNAGVAVSQTVNDMTWEDFEWLMGINFWGVAYGTKAFLPMLLAQDEGAIVNVSSVFGIIGVPTQSAYNAAKFAVRGFTEALRHELKDTGVRAISVHPGGIRTNIARASRFYKDPLGNSDRAGMAARFEQLARTTPEEAAASIVRGVEKGSPRVLIGADARLIDRVQRLLPERYGIVIDALMRRMAQ